MAKYAKGKHAVLIDDRSGFKIKYKNARTEWTGFRVYKGDWEPKQPQLDPQNYISGSEANILYKPRPDQDSVPTTVFLGPLYGKWSGQCAANLGLAVGITPADAPSGFVATSTLGTLVLSSADAPDGFEGTTGLGTLVLNVTEEAEGFVGTTTLGDVVPVLTAAVSMGAMTSGFNSSVVINLDEEAEGFVGTTTLGTLTFSATEVVSGSELGAITSTLGNTGLYVNTTEIPPGLAGTGQLGTVTISIPGWGTSLWGDGTWGE
jgi:hypothetical protein